MAEERKKGESNMLGLYFGPMGMRGILNPMASSGLIKEMERRMEGFREDFDYPLWPSMLTTAMRFPAVDVKDEGEKYTIKADLPGISKEDVTVLIGDGVLDISAERKKETEEEGEGYLRKERGYYSFHRRLSLPDDAEEDVEAQMEDGVLRITIPKRKLPEDEGKKRVQVK
jgi:HSP20 family protein